MNLPSNFIGQDTQDNQGHRGFSGQPGSMVSSENNPLKSCSNLRFVEKNFEEFSQTENTKSGRKKRTNLLEDALRETIKASGNFQIILNVSQFHGSSIKNNERPTTNGNRVTKMDNRTFQKRPNSINCKNNSNIETVKASFLNQNKIKTTSGFYNSRHQTPQIKTES